MGYKVCSVLSQEFKTKFQSRDSYKELLDCFDLDGQLTGRNRVHQSLYLWSKTALTNYILRTLGDGMEMASSVEGRLPFLDHHLFEFVRNLPVSLKIKGTVEKYILREAVKPFVTETIYKRRKHPSSLRLSVLSQRPGLRRLCRTPCAASRFAANPFFDQSKLIALLDRLPSMNEADRAATDPVLMTALSAAAMQDRFKLRGGEIVSAVALRTDWWTSFYQELPLESFMNRAGSAELEDTLKFLWDKLGLQKGNLVFDQCCGTGEVSIPLAQRGVSIVGRRPVRQVHQNRQRSRARIQTQMRLFQRRRLQFCARSAL